MLAETIDNVETTKFPALASPKLDGIRCVILGGKALSRKFKAIPNTFVRTWLEANLPDGIDGELMVKGATFNEVQSAIMSEDGEPDFEFHAFDHVLDGDLEEAFESRYNRLISLVASIESNRLQLVPHIRVNNVKELLDFEEKCLDAEYEGVMLRSPQGGYKCGRSTLKQAWLLKLKRFADSEAVILGFEELMNNNNEKVKNELGLSKRSSHKAGKTGADTLGKFKVRDVTSGAEFEIGTGEGLTQALRKEIWENRDSFLGKLVKYKYQPAGQKDLPRFPVWLGFRDERDVG
jgi:DNA ligase-1